jgi:hypothetical protein
MRLPAKAADNCLEALSHKRFVSHASLESDSIQTGKLYFSAYGVKRQRPALAELLVVSPFAISSESGQKRDDVQASPFQHRLKFKQVAEYLRLHFADKVVPNS